MVNVELLKTKMAQLAEYFRDLKEAQSVTIDEFRSDKKIRRYVERTLHLAIECCLDMGSHIIADNSWREPVSNKDIFAVLEENEVISSDLLPKLQKMAQFRNVLVHDYAKFDPEIVYVILKEDLTDLHEFMSAVNRLL